ncbi:MAG: transposon-transfer assisting family protein [Hominilimicola sp.]
MTFSQDEINLMCIYDTSDKTELLKELRFSVPYIEDTELKELRTVIDKLERMTNDEFSKLELEPDIDMED